MDSFEEDTTADVIIANKKLCHFNVENIELKFEHLMIGDDVDDKKRSKFQSYRILLAKENGNVNFHHCLVILKNKKTKTKSTINSNQLALDYINNVIKTSTTTDIINDDKLIADINDKMASLWTKNGYRNNSDNNFGQKTDKHCLKEKNNLENNNSTETSSVSSSQQQTCAQQATLYDNCDSSLVIELAAYLDETLYIPKKMSFMAEMMYT
ncbi:hypothetical protein BLA29_008535 [Euroglyphus maynei]|uniref:Oxidative stress-responsive serine-rich protein 1 n=1 Tax=Euroglyphus maynei TaxID=6958 RepID=A0A1Y3B1M1_EURMA|nr:hypothetical protein BLA29_008535 [Euroglyphus maynei]